MPQVTCLQVDGQAYRLDLPSGSNTMQAAISAGPAGTVGECGGSVMCATCHVYGLSVPAAAGLPAPTSVEIEVLHCIASERRPQSRLSCQLLLMRRWTAWCCNCRQRRPDPES